MRKFFCFYNNLTERYELSYTPSFRNTSTIQAENTLIPQVRETIQQLYENIVLLKEAEKNEERLGSLDETELLISNLYYSLFASPLELVDQSKNNAASLNDCIRLVDTLIKLINIPEYNRLCLIIKNNLEMLLN